MAMNERSETTGGSRLLKQKITILTLDGTRNADSLSGHGMTSRLKTANPPWATRRWGSPAAPTLAAVAALAVLATTALTPMAVARQAARPAPTREASAPR